MSLQNFGFNGIIIGNNVLVILGTAFKMDLLTYNVVGNTLLINGHYDVCTDIILPYIAGNVCEALDFEICGFGRNPQTLYLLI